MKNNKKGAEITLNTIIIAAIAVIVLIVLVGIFTGKIRFFGEGVNTAEEQAKARICSAQGGYCAPSCQKVNDVEQVVAKEKPAGGWTDCPGQNCCK